MARGGLPDAALHAPAHRAAAGSAPLHEHRLPSTIPAAQSGDGGALGRSLVRGPDQDAVRTLLGVVAFSRASVPDTNYIVRISDTYVGFTSLTAPRSATLPPVETYPSGQPLYVADESGACGTDFPIIIAAAGAKTIAGQPNVSMQSPFQKAVLHSNGTNLWTL